MSKFLTTSEIVAEVERIFRNAKTEISIISPFVDPTRNAIERLLEAEKRCVPITLVVGKRLLKAKTNEAMSDLKKVRMLYYHNLHAKCYANEESLVVTSLNFLAYSEQTNREMGVLLEKANDGKSFEEAERELRSIIEMSEPYDAVFGKYVNKAIDHLEVLESRSTGYCVRCRSDIEIQPDKPLCQKCYAEFARWNNPQYLENYCHTCGVEFGTSYARPLCTRCFHEMK